MSYATKYTTFNCQTGFQSPLTILHYANYVWELILALLY